MVLFGCLELDSCRARWPGASIRWDIGQHYQEDHVDQHYRLILARLDFQSVRESPQLRQYLVDLADPQNPVGQVGQLLPEISI